MNASLHATLQVCDCFNVYFVCVCVCVRVRACMCVCFACSSGVEWPSLTRDLANALCSQREGTPAAI